MRKVVDSNFLQRPELREYLAKSRNNFAVLTDYVAMEAYKGNTLKSIFRSMAILTEFPRQVIVLRSTGVVAGLRGRTAGLQRRLIDESQTRTFPKFCEQLRHAEHGNPLLTRHLLGLGRDADEQMDLIQRTAQELPATLKEIEQEFSREEISILRRTEPFTDALFDKIQRSVLVTTLALIKQHPNTRKVAPPISELPNTFLFRASVCMHAWFFRWVENGSQTQISPEKVRNDVVDINFATFATYFDGILTNDRKLEAIHADARAIIATLPNASIKQAA